MNRKSRLMIAAALGAVATQPVQADEGMWTPSQIPEISEKIQAAGLELPPSALTDLDGYPLGAIVSLGGCSAAFLSPDGLIATNHHCVYGSLQYNSTPDNDLITNGFLARKKSDEVSAAPGSRAYVIESLTDVTSDMLRGAANLTGSARYDKLEDNKKALVSACEAEPNRRCAVGSYYGGKQYVLQKQLEIKDVRLVYAPADGIGTFGGEIDNWQWPRHTGDFGFYRAYVAPDGSSADFSEENVPYKPKRYLKIDEDGVEDGDFVMVAGFPGTTDRHRTAEEARFYYETYYPEVQRLLADYSDAIVKATSGDERTTLLYANTKRGQDNYKKKIAGQIAGAEAGDIIAKKQADEAAFRAWVAADVKRQKQYGASLAALDTLIEEDDAQKVAEIRRGMIGRAALLSAALSGYRWSIEQEKPDAERESGYQDRDRLRREQSIKSIDRRFDPAIDRELFEWSLQEYNKLDDADRVASFDAALAEVGMDRLYSETKLIEPTVRSGLLDMSRSDYENSADPFVKLAVAIYPELKKIEDEEKIRAGDMQKARAGYMEARLAYAKAMGKTLYPDANGTLRITYGNVGPRKLDGEIWTPFTTAEGMAAKHTGKEPFDAPDKALEAIEAKDYGRWAPASLGTLPVDFLSTVDITNGNSGSSTLNSKGEFVGLAFDGTLDGVVSDWYYDARTNRTIHVDSRYMLWTMEKVDQAKELLAELGVVPSGN